MHLVEQIVEGIKADGYDKMPRYSEVAEHINKFVESRRPAAPPILSVVAA